MGSMHTQQKTKDTILCQGYNVFGPLSFEWKMTKNDFAFDVNIFLAGQLADKTLLTRQQPNYPFEVQRGINSATGTLTAQFRTAGQLQKLSGDFDYCIRDCCQKYKGIITSY